MQRKQNGITTIINWKYSILVLTLAALLLSGCKSRAVEEAREVIAVADSLRAEGQGYTDSVAIAEAYNTLEKWQYIYPTDYVHACYHYGRLLRNNDDPVAAMQVFINGTHSRSKDYHILGRIYSNMGSISHLAGEYQLAYDMYSRSADLFLKDGDTVSYYYLLNDMAVELAVQGKKEETLVILNQIESNNATPSILLKVHETKAELYLQVQQYDSALYIAKRISRYQSDEPVGLLICAQAYSLMGIKDSATSYANEALDKSTSIYNKNNLLYIATNDDRTKDIDAIRQVASERADIQKNLLTQKGNLSQATQVLEQDLTRKPDMRGWMIVFIILLSCVVIFIIIRKQRLHRQSIQHKVDIMEDKQVDNITKTIERYIDTNNIEKTLRWKNYVTLKSDADLYMGGIVSTLETYHLNETEIRYCVLFMLDFTPRRIAVMLHYNYPSGIKTLKKRICDKIVTQPQFLKETLLKIQPKM